MPLTLNADGRITSPLLNVDSDGDVSGVRNIENTGTVESTSTSHLALPSGTTAQRPASPANGYIRYNTTLNYTEEYRDGAWEALSNVFLATGGTVTEADGYKIHTFTSSGTFTILAGKSQVEYLVVAGGGSGGAGGSSVCGGGGGAGGMRTGTTNSLNTGEYTVTVGAGASRPVNNADTGGSRGSDSVFDTITSTGGGGGGGNGSNSTEPSGGSGGGGRESDGAGGSGTSGQGNDGGNGSEAGNSGGGGGGAGEAGNTDGLGFGGDGATSSITGTSVTYAGGGGSGNTSNIGAAPGGTGGGGSGSGNTSTDSEDGTANTGGGGGGGYDTGTQNAGAGGSGIVIIRYLV